MSQGDAGLDEVIPELAAAEHSHQNGFQHLDMPLDEPLREYDLGWKFDPDELYPAIQAAEPYLVLYISFGKRGGERRTLHYALTRTHWKTAHELGDKDRRVLWDLAMAQLPHDLAGIQRGDGLQALSSADPMYLAP